MNINSIKEQAKKAYNFDRARNANVEFISSIIKFAIAFTIFTIYFICLAKFGSLMTRPLAVTIFTVAYILFYLFIVAPINMGRDVYYAKVADGIQPETDEIFAFFKNKKAAILPYVRIALVVIFFTVLFALITTIYFKIYSLITSNYFTIINFILLAAIVVLYAMSIIKTRIKYSFYPTIFNMQRDVKPVIVLSRALKFSIGEKFNIFLFYLSFAGWYLLGILTLGIGFIWIKPYIRISARIYYNNLAK